MCPPHPNHARVDDAARQELISRAARRPALPPILHGIRRHGATERSAGHLEPSAGARNPRSASVDGRWRGARLVSPGRDATTATLARKCSAHPVSTYRSDLQGGARAFPQDRQAPSSIARSPPTTSAGRRRARSAARCGARPARRACCSPTCPRSTAGPARDFLYSAVMIEEMAKRVFAAPGFRLHSDIVAPYILNYGSEEQKRTWLPRMAKGEVITAIAMTEPGTGSDLQAIRTTALRQGQRAGGQRAEDLHHQRRARPISSSSPPRPTRRPAPRA